ncbi:MAG TPA: hypothetical protein VIL48_04515 [Acidimicrobiales bacterium]
MSSSITDVLLNLFLADDGSPEHEAAVEEAGELSGDEILQAMPEVIEHLPPEQAAFVSAAYGLEPPEGAPELPPEIANQLPPVPEHATAAELMAHYNTVVDLANDDGDVYIDQSVHQHIEAFGDVNQTFDQAAVTGDGAVQAEHADDINTGDGAVQADGDISDSTIGDGNTHVQDSVMNESSLTGDVTSDDTNVSADHGSTLAFGEGSNATLDTGDTTVGENHGNFAGEGDLTNEVDNSTHDSFNTEGSFNEDQSFDDHSSHSAFSAANSFNTDESYTDGSVHSSYEHSSDDDTVFDDHSSHSESSVFSDSFSSDDDFSFEDHSTSHHSSVFDDGDDSFDVFGH